MTFISRYDSRLISANTDSFEEKIQKKSLSTDAINYTGNLTLEVKINNAITFKDVYFQI